MCVYYIMYYDRYFETTFTPVVVVRAYFRFSSFFEESIHKIVCLLQLYHKSNFPMVARAGNVNSWCSFAPLTTMFAFQAVGIMFICSARVCVGGGGGALLYGSPARGSSERLNFGLLSVRTDNMASSLATFL